MNLDAVIKIGGSLDRGRGLDKVCAEIDRLGNSYRLLVVPGGGEFANQVRKSCLHHPLNDTTAHRMALLAMDQYGWMLSHLIASGEPVTELSSIRHKVKEGGIAVLLPFSAVDAADPLPHSWQVTSDTIAAWVAQSVGCRRLVLLKDVDGLLSFDKGGRMPTKLIANLTVPKLTGITGGVDGYLAHFLATAPIETWIVNGLFPERLSELLNTSRTTGTRIAPATD
jgi:aspartokinase-like uncharacterized kinase